jgi:hypothetical protein
MQHKQSRGGSFRNSGGRGRSYSPRGEHNRSQFTPPKPKYFTGGVSTHMDISSFLKSVGEIIKDEKYLPLTSVAAREIIEGIKGILIPLNIRMTYENLVCLEKIEKIRSIFRLREKNPYIRFEGVEKEEQIVSRFRILMATNRHKANFQIPLVRQANGIVIEIVEIDGKLKCNILVMPSNDFNPNFNHVHTETHVMRGDYDIYEINDGTTLNIYYDPHLINVSTNTILEGAEYQTYKIYKIGKWLRSTKNAFDIDDVIWRGFSYREIVNDVLIQYPEFMGSDNKLCYSIGFKHPAFHPFGQPEEWNKNTKDVEWIKYAWLLQVYNLEENKIVDLDSEIITKIGLPRQKKIENPPSFSELLNRSQNALDTFISQKDLSPFLGYILRSKMPDISDILLESDLWNIIRHAIYQLPFIPNKVVREKQENNFKSMRYVIIDSFLDIRKRQTFTQMFPQFKSKYEELEKIIDNVVNDVYQALNKKQSFSPSLCFELPSYDDTPEQKRQKWIDLLVARLAPITGEQYRPTPNPIIKDGVPISEKSDKKMIKSLIINPKYSDIYASILDI